MINTTVVAVAAVLAPLGAPVVNTPLPKSFPGAIAPVKIELPTPIAGRGVVLPGPIAPMHVNLPGKIAPAIVELPAPKGNLPKKLAALFDGAELIEEPVPVAVPTPVHVPEQDLEGEIGVPVLPLERWEAPVALR